MHNINKLNKDNQSIKTLLTENGYIYLNNKFVPNYKV